ncbi:Hypothetical predicted protein [Cloeon dipterum]|uniref:Inositol polyphosphate-related phosphatase domain-containing protein n=1 Tax=Cloeon dipterum TaxID=197152 RepID=A0A8S1BYG8_9INSE|nr:Hypothetical predicted protein [Cloeon dipterum]
METLRFYFLTWNVATMPPEENFSEMLCLNRETLPDFYIIGLQEVKAQPQNLLMNALFDDPWNNSFRDLLITKDFVKIKTIRLQGLLLSIFCQRRHLLKVRDMETQYTRTGLGGIWGNKGAVSIRLAVSGVSMSIVNCHLSAHDHMKEERVAEYNTILKSHTYSTKETSYVLYHDYVFWLGDLNFRLKSSAKGSLTADQIGALLDKGEIDELFQQDQLKEVMKSGEAFSELHEPAIDFPPTYKFNIHSSIYDLKRRPAWTDRILYKVIPNVYENLTLDCQPASYRSWEKYYQSDHKPVTAEFAVKVISDNHDRVVEFDEIQNWFLDRENSASFELSADVNLETGNDWIGIYKVNFASLEDYVFYIYVPRTSQTAGRLSVTFPDIAIAETGAYQLLYVTHSTASVLGMSAPFPVTKADPTRSPQRLRF